MNNTLSVITICYNIKNEIERTCESIVNQTWQDFEWIVVDGGSTDGTLEVLQKYKHRINVYISEPDKGIYNAMNKGIKLAKGEWLNFMNGGDCFAASDVLEKVFQNKTYTADILYGDMNFIRTNKPACIEQYLPKLTKSFFYHTCINHQASFIKRKLFTQYGLYDESYKIVADWEKWILFLQNGCEFMHLDIIISDFYGGGVSSKRNKKYEAELQKIKNTYFCNIRKTYYLFGLVPLWCDEWVE